MLFSMWLGSLFLKIHLKDKQHRYELDLRKPSHKIADLYDWTKLHHLHCIVRCFYTNAAVEPSALGSCFAIRAKTASTTDDFDFGDLYETQAIFVRLGDTAFYAVFDDAGISMVPVMPILERIRGPLTEVQTRELLAKLAFANFQIRWRPKFVSVSHAEKELIVILAKLPKRVAFKKPDYRMRGRLLKEALGNHFDMTRVRGVSRREFRQSVSAGTFSFILDENGDFIQQEFSRTSKSAS
jgi:hypothetical protein